MIVHCSMRYNFLDRKHVSFTAGAMCVGSAVIAKNVEIDSVG